MTRLLADIFDEGYTKSAGKLDQSSQDYFNDLDLCYTSAGNQNFSGGDHATVNLS